MQVADTFDLVAPIWRSLTYLRTPAIHTGHAGHPSNADNIELHAGRVSPRPACIRGRSKELPRISVNKLKPLPTCPGCSA